MEDKYSGFRKKISRKTLIETLNKTLIKTLIQLSNVGININLISQIIIQRHSSHSAINSVLNPECCYTARDSTLGPVSELGLNLNPGLRLNLVHLFVTESSIPVRD